MPDQYRTTSTSPQSFDIERLNEDGAYERNIEIELSPSGNTRKILRAIIVKNTNRPEQRVKIFLFHQRKLPSGQWEDYESINLARIKGGEGVSLDLHSSATYKLYEQLRNIYEVAESNEYGYGTFDLVVGRANEMIRVESSRAAVIRELINAGFTQEIWDALASTNSDLVTRLSLSRLQENRMESLNQFEIMMELETSEGEWQSFFEVNQWIFGYGLKYVFLNNISTQPIYGGRSAQGNGEQRGDFIESTSGENKFTVLVEIKRQDTQIVLNDLNRSGCNKLSVDLLNGVNQIQVNCFSWETYGSRTPENIENLDNKNIFTIRPKSILIIGDTRQLDSLNKRRAFESFRSSLNQPDIVTFDELYNRAKYIVEKE